MKMYALAAKVKALVKSGQWCPICNGSGIDPESDIGEEDE
jgi:hypothetical protein